MQAEQKAKQTKGFVKIALIAFAILFVISFVFNLISGDDETSTPKQSSAQTQSASKAQTQETQRLESTNSAQISPEPSENIKPNTANTPSDESVNLNENSSENVAQILTQSTIQPSFDCAKASTNAEKLVCSDDELARLDNELANAYKNARNSLDNASKKQLTNEQKSWLKTYNQCDDKPCVLHNLQIRIKTLQGYVSK